MGRTRPDQTDLRDRLEQMADWLGREDRIQRNGRVALKPKLTYSFHKEGVTTSPLFLEVVVGVLREITGNITIVESNGGSNAEGAFEDSTRDDLFTFGACFVVDPPSR